MPKAIVFISHIAEEREIAQALKNVVEAAFLGMIDVFVSSDANSVNLGRQWLATIEKSLRGCKVEIIVASPSSVQRPWINFEAGAGWIRQIPVIPLCHSGMTPGKLPSPLNTLQAALATDQVQLNGLVPELAEAIGSSKPQIDWSPFIDTVRKFETESKQIEELESKSHSQAISGLKAYEQSVLLIIGEKTDEPDDGLATWQIHSEMESAGFTKMGSKLGIASLTRKGFLTPVTVNDNDWNGTEHSGQAITPEGWQWLDDNKERLELIHKKPKPETKPATVPDPPDEDIPF